MDFTDLYLDTVNIEDYPFIIRFKTLLQVEIL